jgi:RNA polymerase primary sigma factor
MVKLLTSILTLATAVSVSEAFAPHIDQTAMSTTGERQLRVSFPIDNTKQQQQQQQRDAITADDILRLERQYQRQQQLTTLAAPASSAATATASATNNNNKTPSRRTHRTGLLTRDEEQQYSLQIRTFRAAMRLRDELVQYDAASQLHVHPTETEWAAACGVTSVLELRRVLHEGQQARVALVAANVGLVTSIAKKQYAALKRAMSSDAAGTGSVGTILTLQDMVQEGNLGLMEAAERFEPERGFRFSTYATYWIRQRILRSVADSSRTIRLPAHVHSMMQRIRRAKIEIKNQNSGKQPTTEELAHHLDVSVEKIKLYEDSSRNVLSLEKPLRTASFREDTRTLGDTLASDAPTPEEDAEADHLRRTIRQVMDTALADYERDVIAKRFGLEDGKPRTVQETADLLGMTPDRIRLVEARALNKLRHPQRNYKLKVYVNGSTGTMNTPASSATGTTVAPRTRSAAASRPQEQPKSDRIWFF